MAEEYSVDSFLDDVDTAVEKLGGDDKNYGLPTIDMSKKQYTTEKGVSYPEMRGSIKFLPVVDEITKKPIVFLSEVYVINVWDEKWNKNVPKFLLEPQFYQKKASRKVVVDGKEETHVYNAGCSELVLDRIHMLRSKCKALVDAKCSFKIVSSKNFAITKAFVIDHKNTLGKTVVSALKKKGQNIAHAGVGAFIQFPSAMVSKKIKEDLNLKGANSPFFSKAVYADVPLIQRSGWVTVSFKGKDKDQVGYEIGVLHDILNPSIGQTSVFPDGMVVDPEIIADLEASDLISEFLRFQTTKESYLNLDTLALMERSIDKAVANPSGEEEKVYTSADLAEAYDNENDELIDIIEAYLAKNPEEQAVSTKPQQNNNVSEDPWTTQPAVSAVVTTESTGNAVAEVVTEVKAPAAVAAPAPAFGGGFPV